MLVIPMWKVSWNGNRGYISAYTTVDMPPPGMRVGEWESWRRKNIPFLRSG